MATARQPKETATNALPAATATVTATATAAFVQLEARTKHTKGSATGRAEGEAHKHTKDFFSSRSECVKLRECNKQNEEDGEETEQLEQQLIVLLKSRSDKVNKSNDDNY